MKEIIGVDLEHRPAAVYCAVAQEKAVQLDRESGNSAFATFARWLQEYTNKCEASRVCCQVDTRTE